MTVRGRSGDKRTDRRFRPVRLETSGIARLNYSPLLLRRRGLLLLYKEGEEQELRLSRGLLACQTRARQSARPCTLRPQTRLGGILVRLWAYLRGLFDQRGLLARIRQS